MIFCASLLDAIYSRFSPQKNYDERKRERESEKRGQTGSEHFQQTSIVSLFVGPEKASKRTSEQASERTNEQTNIDFQACCRGRYQLPHYLYRRAHRLLLLPIHGRRFSQCYTHQYLAHVCQTILSAAIVHVVNARARASMVSELKGTPMILHPHPKEASCALERTAREGRKWGCAALLYVLCYGCDCWHLQLKVRHKHATTGDQDAQTRAANF